MRQNNIDLRQAYMKAYKRAERTGADDYLGAGIYMDECARKSPPSLEEIEDAIFQLGDFGIKVKKIPEFASYADLEAWKKRKLNTRLRRS